MRVFSPVGQALLRRIGLAQSLAEVSEERFVVGAPRDLERTAAAQLPGELDRVTGFAPGRDIALERDRLAPGRLRLPALDGYVLRDALCIDGNLYKARAKHLVAGATRTGFARVAETGPSGVLAGDRQSYLYFGHWLTEELPGSWIGRRHGPGLASHFGRRPYAHEAGYLALHGIAAPTELPARCVVPRLTVLESRGVNTGHLGALEEMQTGLAARGWRPQHRPVFIRRGGGSPRSLVNEAELLEDLSARGVAIVDPEASSPEDIARACFDAAVVIGVEGSHLAHGFLSMHARGAMLVIQPPDRFNNPFKDLCDATGRRYGFVVAEPDGVGFRLAPERLWRTLVLLAP